MIDERDFWVAQMGSGLSEYSSALDYAVIRSGIIDLNLTDKEFFGKWLDVHLLLGEFLSQE